MISRAIIIVDGIYKNNLSVDHCVGWFEAGEINKYPMILIMQGDKANVPFRRIAGKPR